MLKELCCHSEAGLQKISRNHYAMPLPQDRINNASVISDMFSNIVLKTFTERDVITSLGNLLQCLIILILVKFFPKSCLGLSYS